ncbi:nuclear pore complex protein Nup214 [Pseudorasbora parva]|uniref:nuclear pore complex protein Nup214 n=1 Tax=Pseudorasbora parva TaxID=51549 RepID=UPI00351ED816
MADDPDSVPEREMKDFQFRHMKKIRVFESSPDLPKERSSLLSISNKYGLTFAGRDQTLKVFWTRDVIAAGRQEGNPNDIVECSIAAVVTVGVAMHHMALSSDELTLSVCGVGDAADLTLDFYDVRTFLNKMRQEKRPFTSFRPPSARGVLVQDLKWSPVEASRLAVCLSDGSMMVLDLQDSVSVVAQLPATVGITCVCWSPKGKQVSAGKQDATVVQYTPTLQAKKVIPCPSFYSQDHPVKVLDVQWLSTYNFAVAYAAADGSLETPPELVVVSLPKKDEKRGERYLNFNDLVYGTCTERQHHYYLCHIEDWDLVLAASAAAIEVSIIAKQEDKVNWELWLLEDASRAELPVTENSEDTLPVGVAIDYTSQEDIQLSDEKRLPPAPTLMLLSTDGVLCPFSLLNLNPGAKQLSVAAIPLPENGERAPAAKSSSSVAPVSAASSIFPSFSTSSGIAPPPATLSFSAPPPATSFTAPPPATLSFTAPPPATAFTAPPPATLSFTAPPPATSFTAPPPATLSFTAPPPGTLSFTAPPPATLSFTAPPTTTLSFTAPPPATLSFTAPPPAASTAPPTYAASTAPPTYAASTGFSFPSLGSGSAPSGFSLGPTAAGFSFSAPKPPSSDASSFSFTPSTLKEAIGAPASIPSQHLPAVSPIISGPKAPAEPATPAIRMNLTDRFSGVDAMPAVAPAAQPFALTSTPKPTPVEGSVHKPATPAVMSRSAAPPAALQKPASVAPPASAQAVSVKALEKHLQQKKDSDPVMTGILEEIAHFQKELDELKTRCRNADFRVGSTDDMRDLRRDSEDFHTFTQEIKDTTESLHGDISALKTSLLEGFAGAEEARAQSELNRDTNYLQLLYKKPLDPRREEQLKEIRRLYQYVKFAMDDVNGVLDVEWEMHLEKKKKQRHMIVPERQALFAALANNLDIINQQKQRLDRLTDDLHKLRLYRGTSVRSFSSRSPSTPSEQSLDSELESLKDALLKASLEMAPKSTAKSPSKMTPAKQSQLRNFLSKRQTPPVRSTAPANLSRSAFLSPQFYEDLDEESSSSSLSQPLEPEDRLAMAEEEDELEPAVPVLELPVPRHPAVVRTPSIQPGFGMQTSLFSRVQSGPVMSAAPKINMDSADSTMLATKTVKHGAPPTEKATPTTVPAPQAAGRAALNRHMTSQKPGASLTESTLKTVPQVVNVQELKDKGPPIPVSTVISASVPAPAAQVVQQVLATVEASKTSFQGALKIPVPLAGPAQTTSSSFVFGGAAKPDASSCVSEKNSKGFSFSAASAGFGFSPQSQDTNNTQVAKSSGPPGKFSFASSAGAKTPFGPVGSEEPFSFTPKLSSPSPSVSSSTPTPEPPKPSQAPKAPGITGETLGCFSGLRVGQSEEAKDAPKTALSFAFGPPGNGSTGFTFTSAQIKPAETVGATELPSATTEPPKMATPQGLIKPQEGAAPSINPTFSIPSSMSFSPVTTSITSFSPVTTSTMSFSPVVTSTTSFSPVPTSTTSFSPVPTSTTSFSPVSTSTTSFSPVPTSTTSFSPVPTSTTSFSPVPTSTTSFSPVPTSTTSFSPVPTSTFSPVATSFGSLLRAPLQETLPAKPLPTPESANVEPPDPSPKPPTSAPVVSVTDAETTKPPLTLPTLEVSPTHTPSVTPPSETPAADPTIESSNTAPQGTPSASSPTSDKPGSIFAPPSTTNESLGAVSFATTVASSTTSTAPTPAFGQPSAAFGSTTFSGSSPPSGFGKLAFVQNATPGFGQPAGSGSASGFTFGQAAFSGSSGFGQPAATATTSAGGGGGGGGLFGAANTNSASSFSFGASATSSAASTSTGLFPQNTAPGFGQPSSGFGQGSMFGSNTTTASSGFGFGQPSGFGSNTSSSSVFGQQPSSAGVFGQPQSSGGLFGSNAGNASSGFFSGLGGKPSEDAANKNPFGAPAGGGFGQPINTGSSNLFGSSGAKAFSFGSSSFGEQKPSGSFSTGAGSVAAQGFGSFSTPTKPAGFGSAPVFGSPPTFGGSPAFGAAAGFGSAPSFSSPMGGSSGKVFGEGTTASNVGGFGFASPPNAPSFGSLANPSAAAPSFGSLAQQPSGFGAQTGSFSGFGSPGGFGGFGNTNSNQPSPQTFSSWRS